MPIELKAKIEELNDGEFIDLLDRITNMTVGLTATEWIIHEYIVNKEVRKMIEEDYNN